MVQFAAHPRYPERDRFVGLPTYAVHAFIRGLEKAALRVKWVTDDEIAALTDEQMLLLPGVGRKTVVAIRSRFPYRAEEAV